MQDFEDTTRSMSDLNLFFSKLSFNKKDRLKRWISPSNFAVFGQFEGGFFNFLGSVYKKVFNSSSE